MEQKDILIVDDDENMNFALFETLRRKDYSVERAFSYLEAKEKIRFFNFPMVVTDVRMPDGNGIQLVSEIKAKNPETKVIVITAYGKIEDAVTALKNGAEDYILKPFSADKILKVVDQLFPRLFNRNPVRDFLTKDASFHQEGITADPSFPQQFAENQQPIHKGTRTHPHLPELIGIPL